MSRSAERAGLRRGPGRVTAVALGSLALSLGVTVVPTAAAAGRPPASWTEDPTTPAPGGGVLPVVGMVMPVVGMVGPTKDITGVAVIEEREKKIDVRLDANVLFPKDSDAIRPSANARLREVALTLKARGAGKVGIDGYTDDLGSAAHGLDLSRRRANAIATRLRTVLPAAQFPFVVRGLGESNFVAPNTSEANRSKNRRVEIHFTAT